MTYPSPDGSSYDRGPGAVVEGHHRQRLRRSQPRRGPQPTAGADQWTQGLLDKLNNGKPITTQTTE
jgi:hypothetical protein